MRLLRSAVLLVLLGCQASTTRPGFAALPDASRAEVHLSVPEATRLLGEALRADSFPLARVEERDGWLESAWFSFPGFQPAEGRVLGPDQVKVRAWADPHGVGPPVSSIITIEVVYRLYEDPSLPAREAERHVPDGHSARQRALAVLRGLVGRFGHPEEQRRLAPAAARPDTGR